MPLGGSPLGAEPLGGQPPTLPPVAPPPPPPPEPAPTATYPSVIAQAISMALLSLEADTGNPTLTWKGMVLACVPSTVRRGTVIILGGVEVEIQLTLFVRKTLFPQGVTADSTIFTADSTLWSADQDNVTPPTASKLITHRNRKYRILGVGDAPGGSHFEIDVGDPNK